MEAIVYGKLVAQKNDWNYGNIIFHSLEFRPTNAHTVMKITTLQRKSFHVFRASLGLSSREAQFYTTDLGCM
jgi:hypothetical protein